MNLYECPEHETNFDHPTCEDCIRIKKIIKHNKEVSDRTPRTAKMQMSVYWPSEMGSEGRLIHNLEHKPQFFPLKRDYRNYLKKSGLREKG